MKQYKKTEYHFIRNTGEMNGDEIAKLSDERLNEYLDKISLQEENKKYRIKSGYVLREIAGECVIVPVDTESTITNAVMVPNDTAVFMWKAFERPCTLEDVVKKGMQEYEVTEETIRDSAERFIKESLKYQILEEDV